MYLLILQQYKRSNSKAMTDFAKEPLLLTPGPLTTSRTVKEAMSRDWGARDALFVEMTSRVRRAFEKISGVEVDGGSHTCIPIQGSGTFAVEAAITSFVPRNGKVLVLVNGAYGRRICRICNYHNRTFTSYETGENVIPSPDDLMSLLEADAEITDVIAVHCETTSGILNPIEEIAEVVTKAKCRFIVDAMSTFGAVKLDVKDTPCSAVIASSNKCLEGVPGLGFVLVEKEILESSEGISNSLSLDLYDQWINLENTGQWRFTPPTHVLAAFDQALLEHEAEGGVRGRYARYQKNYQVLVDGMRALGFRTYLPDHLQAPIIITFYAPTHERFSFDQFYDSLKIRGFAIYPGKLTEIDTFRIGCIGRLDEGDMTAVVSSVREVISEMGVTL